MPTGYTSDFTEGKQTIKEFLMGCTTAFIGEDGIDGYIQAIAYHKRQYHEEHDTLQILLGMSEEDKIAFGNKQKEEAADYLVESLRERVLGNMRLREARKVLAALVDVDQFTEFVTDQIERSEENVEFFIKNIMKNKYTDPMHFYNIVVDSAKSNVEYYENKTKMYIDECQAKRKWLKSLTNQLNQILGD